MADTVVEMVDTAFEPRIEGIAVGRAVMWTSEGTFSHDATSAQFSAAAADWEFRRELAPGESVTRTFDSEGIHEYYCTVHGRETTWGGSSSGTSPRTVLCRAGTATGTATTGDTAATAGTEPARRRVRVGSRPRARAPDGSAVSRRSLRPQGVSNANE